MLGGSGHLRIERIGAGTKPGGCAVHLLAATLQVFTCCCLCPDIDRNQVAESGNSCATTATGASLADELADSSNLGNMSELVGN